MSAGVVRLSDVIVPSIFAPYVMRETAEKSRLIQSGAVVADSELSGFLGGAGVTFNKPFWKDLDNDAENIATDDPTVKSSPNKIATGQEIQVRLSRNNSWSSMDLTADLLAADPLAAIGSRISAYWTRRIQAAFVATMKGVFADNAAAPTGSEHVQNDLTVDIKGASFTNNVTNFSAEAFIDATGTMGDSMEDLRMIMVHSVVYARMQKNNLIDFIPDSRGETNIPTFLGRIVIVDDGMPATAGVYESWLFGGGAVAIGMGSPKVPVETKRDPDAGNGSGQETIWSRMELALHPVGHAYVGTPANGGPSNAATTNNLAHADSWARRFVERKQIKIARLITREF